MLGWLKIIGANWQIWAIAFGIGFVAGNYTGLKFGGWIDNLFCNSAKGVIVDTAKDNNAITKEANDDLQKHYASIDCPKPKLMYRKCPTVHAAGAPITSADRDETVGEVRFGMEQCREFIRQNCDRLYGERVVLESFITKTWDRHGQ